MEDLTDISIKICNYKCFGSKLGGYDRILPINLIIGRNNSGKSSLIDLIDYGVAPKDLSHLGHKSQSPCVVMSDVLFEHEIGRVFSTNTSGGSISSHYRNHFEFGKAWIGKKISLELAAPRGGNKFISLDPPFGLRDSAQYESRLAEAKKNRLQNFTFKRLVADRDIFSEESYSEFLTDRNKELIRPNGVGATNAIQSFINRNSLPSDLVEKTLLEDLNCIFEPDASFIRILVQQLGKDKDEKWEVFLEEEGKGRIPLSQSGSGIKTVLLVLIYLHLVPHIEDKQLADYFFGFEELENNLHPALQRRLLTYLRKTAIEKGCHFFLTTHSSVAIDLFASDDQAQILHVTHNGKQASVKTVKTYVENCGVLDDLDIRASDLLQANGIVWVEGPTDRLYFNRWIDVWAAGKLKEGTHYQCVFYGGRLLAHLAANDPDLNPDDLVKILRVNRNAILLADSDKRSAGDKINKTKQRLVSEILEFGGLGWVTAGREVENYIPKSVLDETFPEGTKNQFKQYDNIAQYLEKIQKGKGEQFKQKKMLFAEHILPHLTKENLAQTYDLAENLDTVCRVIRKWNGLSEINQK